MIAKDAMSLLVSLLIGAAGTASQLWMLARLGVAVGSEPSLAWAMLVVPLVAALLAGALSSQRAPDRVVPTPPREIVPPPEPPEHAALRVLAFLQEEGRLIDFLTEDVGPYSDEQIGVAMRGIHASCAKALREVVTLERILPGNEDDAVTLEAGFDAGAIRLVGNVGAAPPFHGTLRHGGWRASHVIVPARGGDRSRRAGARRSGDRLARAHGGIPLPRRDRPRHHQHRLRVRRYAARAGDRGLRDPAAHRRRPRRAS